MLIRISKCRNDVMYIENCTSLMDYTQLLRHKSTGMEAARRRSICLSLYVIHDLQKVFFLCRYILAFI